MTSYQPARSREPASANPSAGTGPATDYTALDDSSLIAWRREVREQLEREPPNMADLVRAHHLLTAEVVRRSVTLRKQAAEKETS